MKVFFMSEFRESEEWGKSGTWYYSCHATVSWDEINEKEEHKWGSINRSVNQGNKDKESDKGKPKTKFHWNRVSNSYLTIPEDLSSALSG